MFPTMKSICTSSLITICFIAYCATVSQKPKDLPVDAISNTTTLLQAGLRKGRWGIFFSYEPVCTKACVQNGKYGGRMYGGICRCYCVRNEPDPCLSTYPSCDRLCKLNFYPRGGDCVDGKFCYCSCSVRQAQTPNSTLTTTTAAPCATTVVPMGQLPGGGVAPSPGTLGIGSQGGSYARRPTLYSHM